VPERGAFDLNLKRKKQFFSEKKNQKTFILAPAQSFEPLSIRPGLHQEKVFSFLTPSEWA
jgi:hypothetical protein